MNVNDRVKVIGPAGSAQLDKVGTVVAVESAVVVVQLDGEARPRNFVAVNLEKL